MNRNLSLFAGVFCLGMWVSFDAAGQAIQAVPDSKGLHQPSISVGTAPGRTHAVPRVSFSAMPLSFEPNLGQADSSARFISRSAGYSLRLESTGASFQFNSRDNVKSATVRMDLA